MTISKRLNLIFMGILLIICGILLIEYPDKGHGFVVLILDVTLLLYGFRLFVYYFTMARFMVEGISILYKSIIIIDFGLFVFTMSNTPRRLTMLYLVGLLAFDGVTDVLRALEKMKLEATSWRFELFCGSVKIILCIISLFFLDSVRIMSYIYAAGMLHSGVSNIIAAFRKHELKEVSKYV